MIYPLIEARELTKVYARGNEQVRALDSVSFQIAESEFVAVVGPSGSGKTTLLNLLGCMDTPSSGSLRFSECEVSGFDEAARTRFRREKIGFVFQQFSLLPTLTVAENVALPALFARRSAQTRVDQLLERVGLTHRRNHRPDELSGGEMQRAAIARALINNPEILLADEPTGNLDSVTGQSILELFRELNATGLTIITVTHNQVMAQAAKRQISLQDGRLA
jgi:putative ABC transport system ATP-binding protein